jgi:hypothetical protein
VRRLSLKDSARRAYVTLVTKEEKSDRPVLRCFFGVPLEFTPREPRWPPTCCATSCMVDAEELVRIQWNAPQDERGYRGRLVESDRAAMCRCRRRDRLPTRR